MTASSPRPLIRRIGVASLNLLAPGLGLARTGPVRPALLLLVAGPLATFGVAALFAGLPTLGPATWATLMLLLLAAWLTALIVSLVATWRASRGQVARGRWSRWYAIVALLAAATVAANVAVDMVMGGYRMWHAAGEAMLPGLDVGTVFVVDMRRREPPRIGDIVMVPGPGGTEYVKRVAALGGSTVAMRRGTPVIDGRAADQRLVGGRIVNDDDGPHRVRVVAERLPGDPRSHQVLDLDLEGFLDDLPPTRIPAGHVYLLGDHRDRSADSRVPRSEGGLGMVPAADVHGRAVFALWTADHRWLGSDLHR